MRSSGSGSMISPWTTAASSTGSKTTSPRPGSRLGRERRAGDRELPRQAPRVPELPRRSSVRLGFSPAPRGYFAPVAEFKPSYLVQRPPGPSAAPAAHRRDDRDLHLRDGRGGAEQARRRRAHGSRQAWWLALVVGLVITVPTALTGLADWLLDHPWQRALEDRDAAHDRRWSPRPSSSCSRRSSATSCYTAHDLTTGRSC